MSLKKDNKIRERKKLDVYLGLEKDFFESYGKTLLKLDNPLYEFSIFRDHRKVVVIPDYHFNSDMIRYNFKVLSTCYREVFEENPASKLKLPKVIKPSDERETSINFLDDFETLEEAVKPTDAVNSVSYRTGEAFRGGPIPPDEYIKAALSIEEKDFIPEEEYEDERRRLAMISEATLGLLYVKLTYLHIQCRLRQRSGSRHEFVVSSENYSTPFTFQRYAIIAGGPTTIIRPKKRAPRSKFFHVFTDKYSQVCIEGLKEDAVKAGVNHEGYRTVPGDWERFRELQKDRHRILADFIGDGEN